MFELIKVKKNEYPIIESLASSIWTEHYTPIIGAAQVEYMLKNFQSSGAIEKSVGEGSEYFFIKSGGKAIGYFAYAQKADSLFISKLYLLKEHRGSGGGRFCFEEAKKTAKERKLSKIWLTVNCNNSSSIEAYKKLGFIFTEKKRQDIGGGFFMDDYILSYDI